VASGAFGIPAKIRARGATWRILWGIPKSHRCKGCRAGRRDWDGFACTACKTIILSPTLLKDPRLAWRVFIHELMHLANFGVAHEHINRLEGVGQILFESGVRFPK
jgi:hypothetical protein